ncbi:hypothetical protein BDA99DRAFT_502820 [Phascolomyces articulosus]|uniref:Uncharacterized protein n=1 Tax=Phascolomyces articulosus TaxID=60185 RepID=A0AAD5K457_9FUNG|nr:hypothetical protein BDA99DRAFT_502820 [Phascolomyces articulosus]
MTMIRIKWANPQKLQGRVQKRSRTTTSSSTTKKYHRKIPKNNTSLHDLENELEHSLDSLASVTVMLESLRHAYTTCKSDIDQSSTATRLGAMEKELLTAYDDLGIQVRQLGRHITKLEKQIKEFHGGAPTPATSVTSSSTQSNISYYSPTTTATTSPATPHMTLEYEENTTPSLTYLPYEATTPPSYDYYNPITPAPPISAITTLSYQDQTLTTLPAQQVNDSSSVAALYHSSNPCTCADCCSHQNNNTFNYYNDMVWSYPPPDVSAPLL